MSTPDPLHLLETASSDNALMARIQHGSHQAFAEIYDRYHGQAYTVARSVAVDRAQAEEAVQESFAVIWTSCASYEPRTATASPWLMTIVRHRAIDLRRRSATRERRRAGESWLEDLSSGEDIAADAAARGDRRDLWALLERLPEAQRTIVILAFYGQRTHTEIAAELGVPLGTVKGRMRLGLEKLCEFERTGP